MKTLILILSLIFCAGSYSFSQKKSHLEIGTVISSPELLYPEIILEYSWDGFGISGFYKRTINTSGEPKIRFNGAGARLHVYLNKGIYEDHLVSIGMEVIKNANFERGAWETYNLSDGYGVFLSDKCHIEESRINLLLKYGALYCPGLRQKFWVTGYLGISYRLIK